MDVVNKRKLWYAISAVLLLVGVVSLLFRGLNLGIDFTGGNIMQLQFSQTVTSEELRSVVSSYVEATPTIQASDNNVFLIRTEDMPEEQSNQLLTQVESELGSFEILRNERIGPVIGAELIANAWWALLLALALMLLYITIRFRFNFAVSAIVPLMHDALMVLGIFSILQVEVDSTFVAAILTVLGYSINSTIVIFDRIRENRELHPKQGFTDLINESINQTLGRSINTSVAVLLLVLCLFLFGGDTTKAFSLALVIGVIAGAYSSVFIAGSILSDLTRLRGVDKNEIRAAKKGKKNDDKILV
ncbi:MAG: protein translocase subunit SecF [Peptococcaceae bacterium]|nr:protein translocase subunit SecF [Peptococcaceae bacterium]